tara:strand:- start:499 stop:855 length:357 start_codon:yes stop_codon:yes gene_type:complete
MENFDLRKFLTESTISEVAGKVLMDKVDKRWVILDKDGKQAPFPFENKYYTSPKVAQNSLDSEVEEREYASTTDPESIEPKLRRRSSMGSEEERQATYKEVSQYKVQEVELKMTVTIK